ncbi:MAG: divalent-cation tolerance protein CutA [Pseudomonadota bacterium]
MTANKPTLIFCTCPNEDAARKVATAVVERRLAACVNIIPGVRSIYRWEGAIADDQEHLLLMKTNESQIDPLVEFVEQIHPYELPEIIAVNIEHGLGKYLTWIEDEVS